MTRLNIPVAEHMQGLEQGGPVVAQEDVSLVVGAEAARRARRVALKQVHASMMPGRPCVIPPAGGQLLPEEGLKRS